MISGGNTIRQFVSKLGQPSPYRYFRRFIQHTGTIRFIGYLWRTGLTMVGLISVLFVAERLVLQFVPGFQISGFALASALLISLLISGYVVYINAIANHQSAIQASNHHLRQAKTECQRAVDLEKQSYRTLQDKYEELSQELKQNQQRIPQVIFGLHNGSSPGISSSRHVDLPERPPEPDYDAIVDRHLEAVREHLIPAPSQRRPSPFDDFVILGRRPNPTFEQEAAAYPERFLAYAQSALCFHLARDYGRLIQVHPAATNQGTAPADDVVIELHFPEGIRPATDEEDYWLYSEFEYEPEAPSLPQQTKSFLDPVILDLSSIESIARPERAIESPILDDPENPRRVTYRIRRLVQGVVERGFDPLPIWLGDVMQDASYDIEVEIYSSSLPSAAPMKSSITLDCRVMKKIE